MPIEPPISGQILENMSIVLAGRMTHTEISRYLPESGLVDTSPDLSKMKRIFNSFADYQNRYKQSNKIQVFIQKAFSPQRFVGDNERFESIRTEINERLCFVGLELLPTGKYRRVTTATTIPEAQQRADVLRQKLQNRTVHNDILLFCKAELLQDNYFHAVFEATKSVADKIRNKSGLSMDGSELVDKAFSLGQTKSPILSFNNLANESEESEHKGFMNLVKGLFGMFRNTTAHAPKIKWPINEHDALDSLTLASLIHRKLDICAPKSHLDN